MYILTEVDAQDNEYDCGAKTIVIPIHTQPRCWDVIVWCIKFVLPEELDMSGSPNLLRDERFLSPVYRELYRQ